MGNTTGKNPTINLIGYKFPDGTILVVSSVGSACLQNGQPAGPLSFAYVPNSSQTQSMLASNRLNITNIASTLASAQFKTRLCPGGNGNNIEINWTGQVGFDSQYVVTNNGNPVSAFDVQQVSLTNSSNCVILTPDTYQIINSVNCNSSASTRQGSNE